MTDRRSTGRGAIDTRFPDQLPGTLDALAAISALVHTWSAPQFQHALAQRIEPEPDLPVLLMIRHLGMFGGQTPSDIGAALGMSRSNASKVINRAQDRDLVVRVGNQRDLRSVTVTLTEAGSELANRCTRAGDEMMRELIADWDESDRAAWIRLSRRLSRDAAQYAARLVRSAESAE